MEKKLVIRTDLVVENEEMVRHRTEQEKETLDQSKGIQFNEFREGRMVITEVLVDAQGEQKIGKRQGTYITLTTPTLQASEKDGLEQMAKRLTKYLNELANKRQIDEKGKVVIIGLGNRESTPDAIGPSTIDCLQQIVPDYFDEEGADVVVYAPGVTIQTGLETAHFVKAIVNETKPSVLIVIDALAARDSTRLCRTIQLTDTGIHPGSGVGNSRKEISEDTLGIPVFAIGIPTVVDAPVFIADAIDSMFQFIAAQIEEKNSPSSRLSVSPWLYNAKKESDRSTLIPIFGDWTNWPHEERIQLFEEVLTSHELHSFISPKEIDAWVALYATVLSDAIQQFVGTLKKSH